MFEKIQIIKRREFEFGDFRKTDFFDFRSQNAFIIHRRKKNVMSFVFAQKPRKLDGLAFRAALMKAADKLKHIFFHWRIVRGFMIL